MDKRKIFVIDSEAVGNNNEEKSNDNDKKAK